MDKIKWALILQEFLATDPILSEYKAKVAMFKKLEDNIDDIPTSEVVGPIELFTGKSWSGVNVFFTIFVFFP